MPKETLSKVSTRNCNIDILRLIAAVFVMAGHMGHICGGHVPTLFMDTDTYVGGIYSFFHQWCVDYEELVVRSKSSSLCFEKVFQDFPTACCLHIFDGIRSGANFIVVIHGGVFSECWDICIFEKSIALAGICFAWRIWEYTICGGCEWFIVDNSR